jgi:hypothetical protein
MHAHVRCGVGGVPLNASRQQEEVSVTTRVKGSAPHHSSPWADTMIARSRPE